MSVSGVAIGSQEVQCHRLAGGFSATAYVRDGQRQGLGPWVPGGNGRPPHTLMSYNTTAAYLTDPLRNELTYWAMKWRRADFSAGWNCCIKVDRPRTNGTPSTASVGFLLKRPTFFTYESLGICHNTMRNAKKGKYSSFAL